MSLTRVAISRPVFILMVILGLVMMGALSYSRLGVELFPSLNVPVVTVSTGYPGATPEDVERLVTKPIEDAVTGINQVDYVASSSSEGRSTVTIVFTDRANTDLAATDVERRISAIRATLPSDVLPPSVLKQDPNAQPIMFLSLAGNRPLDQLFVLAKETVKPRLEAADGVAAATISGGLEREIQVKLLPERLRGFGLSLDQVQAALGRENVSLPGGSIDRERQQINVRVSGPFGTVADLKELIISQGPNGTITLKDIASVEDTFKKINVINRLNGNNTVTLAITRLATANEVRTAEAVRAEIARLADRLPTGVALEVISDCAAFTKTSLDSVNRTLLESSC
jgi:hydrophobic/amphiphilic exporter-1 (mainly G- bacteria), HAE1 family